VFQFRLQSRPVGVQLGVTVAMTRSLSNRSGDQGGVSHSKVRSSCGCLKQIDPAHSLPVHGVAVQIRPRFQQERHGRYGKRRACRAKCGIRFLENGALDRRS
jgi:hypothetical protein